MGRIYAVPLSGTITNAGGNSDLWSIQPASNKPVTLRGFVLGQTSELGDAAEEGMRLTGLLLPATFTVGSGGNAVTAVRPPRDRGGPVWGATVRTNDTTVATTSGTAFTALDMAWNERNTPFDWWWPEDRFSFTGINGEGLIIRLENTIADDLTFEGTLWF